MDEATFNKFRDEYEVNITSLQSQVSALQNELREYKNREKQTLDLIQELSDELSTLKLTLQSGACFQREERQPSEPEIEAPQELEIVEEVVEERPPVPSPMLPEPMEQHEAPASEPIEEAVIFPSIFASTRLHPFLRQNFAKLDYRPICHYHSHDDVLGRCVFDRQLFLDVLRRGTCPLA